MEWNDDCYSYNHYNRINLRLCHIRTFSQSDSGRTGYGYISNTYFVVIVRNEMTNENEVTLSIGKSNRYARVIGYAVRGR